jgi:peptide/nickel transport system ATP-binding protein
VTVQAQILDLLQDLQSEFDTAIILITHDLGVIAEVADDVLVMYAGRAVEYGTTKQLLTHPAMPYTRGLIQSVPDVHGPLDRPLRPIPGNPPSLLNPPTGCAFFPRCEYSHLVGGDTCETVLPKLAGVGDKHLKRCHLEDASVLYGPIDDIAPVEETGAKVGER